jgi:hypothetical protein
LSPDGKSVYVLLTHTVGTKKASSLILIDAASRKETKRAELPELARDLTKSPDGKTLIIIDDMNAKLKTMGAHVDRGPLDGPFAPGYYYIVFEDPDGIRLEVNFIPGKGLLAQDPPINPSSDPNWDQNSGRPRF